jgi:TolB-like protein/DNA-binding winged helix-turn-helix (wHTH) protein/Tfp pilus assembly protein PilF
MEGRTYRFAEFELNVAESELRTAYSVVRLQRKPLLLLSALLDHPQRLVTREELRDRMWDGRTIVDYEQGINVAAKKVRDALGDSAENPKYMETVARKGYRLLVPVDVVSPDVNAQTIAEPPFVAVNTAVPEPIVAAERTVRRRWVASTVAVAILCAVGLGLSLEPAGPRHAAPIRSLAVLPLQDLSADSGQEYLADGVTEDVITSLAQILPVRVISRTSVMRYKKTDKPITQIARELGVEAIVEGAVARTGDRVTVTLQLIDAIEDRHLWAQKYARRLEDMPAIEAEMSQAIARQISGTPNLQHAMLTDSRPVDPQVLELCLMGRYHWNKRTSADFAKAEEYYQQAAARDPRYAPAYAGLADVYAMQPNYGAIAWRESLAKASAAARHALELDDSSAEAHATLGFISVSTNPGSVMAEAEFRRAIELNPNYATAHHWIAYSLFFTDRRDEALAEIELARQLDPLSAITNADEGHFLYAVRRYEEARVRLRQAIELEPDLGQSHETLALIELETGHPLNALKEARAGLALDPSNPRTMGEAGYVLASTGQTAEAQKLLANLKNLTHRGSSFPVFSALVEIGLGQRNEALDTLTEMVQSKSGGGVHALGQWHGFEALSSDSRYQNLMAQQL